MINKYTKCPVTIEAVQLTVHNTREVLNFIGQQVVTDSRIAEDRFEDYRQLVKEQGMNIPTLEDGADGRAKHVASIGDFIIKGVQGEFYPCKPDIFHMTYISAKANEMGE